MYTKVLGVGLSRKFLKQAVAVTKIKSENRTGSQVVSVDMLRNFLMKPY